MCAGRERRRWDSRSRASQLTVVGWGAVASRGRSVDYWILRNQWSTFWGEAGYGYLQRGGMCGSSTELIYPNAVQSV